MKKTLFALPILLITLFVAITFLPMTKVPEVRSEEKNGPPGILMEKTPGTHRHVILEGGDFHRGSEWGRLTGDKLLYQENVLVSKLDSFLGNQFIQKIFFSFARLWFHDVDNYIDTGSLKEMYGVSHYAPEKYDYLADRFTRQIAYHGLHEVGQMFVDNDQADMCYATIIPGNNSWYVGRNFDFDIDGVFDREKILKWVYPENGIPFLSIIWAGMVGVVTGVNEQGLFVSLNAAGSEDFARVGTPTTIVVKNILQHADSLEKAISMLKESQVFITDIFILADRKTQRIAIVEKSPERFHLRMVKGPEVVSNHLMGDVWSGDETNINRKNNFTSLTRYQRGIELQKETAGLSPLEAGLMFLRDKKLPNGAAGYPGNRGAIDSLIASQSVIYDMKEGVLYVSSGPGTNGVYPGYDLKKSFASKRPAIVNQLPRDNFPEENFLNLQALISKLGKIGKALNADDCGEAGNLLAGIKQNDFIHSEKEKLLGDFEEKCKKNPEVARAHWKAALELHPPYASQRKYLEDKLR